MLIEAPNAGDANTAGLSSVWSHDDIISQERTGDQTEEPLMEFYHHGAAQMPTNWNDPSMTTGTVMFWGWNSFVWYISIWHFWYVECWVCLRGKKFAIDLATKHLRGWIATVRIQTGNSKSASELDLAAEVWQRRQTITEPKVKTSCEPTVSTWCTCNVCKGMYM